MRSRGRPTLTPGVRLKFDHLEKTWLLLGPERGLVLNETARAVLELCDGTRSFEALLGVIVARFKAPPFEIERDVLSLVSRLERDTWLVLRD